MSLASSQLSLFDVSSSDISAKAYVKPISNVGDYTMLSAFFPGAGSDPALSGITTSFFVASVLFFAPFICDSGEKQNGIRLEGIRGSGGNLVLAVSVASMFTDEAFERVPFLVSLERSAFLGTAHR